MDHIKIIIADKHPAVRMGLERVLWNELGLKGTVTHCSSLTDACAHMRKDQQPVDLVVAGYAFNSAKEIRTLLKVSRAIFGHETPVLVVSEPDDLPFAPRVMAAGAMGFVPKNAPLSTLSEAIDTIIKGGYFLGSRSLLRQADREKLKKQQDNPLLKLSTREIEIGSFLAKQLSRHEISEALALRPTTVYAYVRRIFKKLHVTNTEQFINVWKDGQSAYNVTIPPPMQPQLLRLSNAYDTTLPKTRRC